jgi:deoxyribonuclease-4
MNQKKSNFLFACLFFEKLNKIKYLKIKPVKIKLMKEQEKLLIGAHTSASGGVHHALIEGQSINATTIQLFTANQRRWISPALTEESIEIFKETKKQTGISHIMSHASYLINMASCNIDILEKSKALFKEEFQRCLDLGITFLNFHPGSAVGTTKEKAINTIINSLLEVKKFAQQEETLILLETTAGAGSTIGSTFEELNAIINGVKSEIPIGVCVDTCHIFAAGYDISTPHAIDKMLMEFNDIIGLNYLKAFHLNDSIGTLGSKKDRHAPLGEGEIGIECFKYLMQNPKTAFIPKYLETPDGPELWKKEIAMLRKFAS